MQDIAWSYSKVSSFKQCPKKYYHVYVAKDVKDKGNAATLYGNQVHKAAELYIATGKELEPEFSFMQGTLDAFNKIEGEKHCEIRFGVSKEDGEYGPTTFFSKDVWYRGIADLLIINDNKAFIVDYKSSKSSRYADTKQLDLLAGATFVHYPQVEVVKSALSFVVCNEFVSKEHTVDMYKSYLSVFDDELERIEAAKDNDVWNPVPSGLCGFCPVTKCPHHRD